MPLGSVGAVLSGATGGGLHAVIAQSGDLGSSGLIGDVSFRRHHGVLPDFGSAAFSVAGNVDHADLGLAARFAGLEDVGLRGTLDASVQASGTPRHTSGTASFTVQDGYVRKVPLRAAQGIAVGGSLDPHAALQPAWNCRSAARRRLDRSAATASCTRSPTSWSRILRGVGALIGRPVALRGSATGTLRSRATCTRRSYTAFVRAGKGSAFGVAFDGLSAHASYSEQSLEISDTTLTLGGGGGSIDLAGSLPLQLKPLALGPPERRMDVRLRGQKIDLAVFDPLLDRFRHARRLARRRPPRRPAPPANPISPVPRRCKAGK